MFSDFLVFDCETGVIDGATRFMETFTEKDAPKNYKDPEAIAKWVAKKNQAQLEKTSLDIDLARIVAIAYWHVGLPFPDGIEVKVASSEDSEARLLSWFAEALRSEAGGSRTLVGHNILDFDIPLVMRRALYLGVKFPDINIDRYRSPHKDIQQILSHNGKMTYRTKDFYCRRFGIAVEDPMKGSDIQVAIAMKDWQGIANHARADVTKEALLAHRVISSFPDPMLAPPSMAQATGNLADIPF
jgi:DNA polymerase elongation subunit (family B)